MTGILIAAVTALAAMGVHSTVVLLKELRTMSQSLDNLTAAVTKLEAAAAASVAGKTDDSAQLDALTTRVDAVTATLTPAAPAPTPGA